MRFWLGLFLSLWVTAAAAQTTVIPAYKSSATGSTQVSPTNPLPVTPSGSGVVGKTTTEAKVTIAATNTYQTALASSSARVGCTIQYIAVAGTKGYVFFGSTPADTTTSFQLTSGQALNCAIGGTAVATDAIQVTATQNDIFVVSNQ